MRINLFRHLQWLLSNTTNNINQIAKATNTTGVIYKNEIESINKQIEKLSKRYGIYIPYFLINQKKVMVFSMAITKIHPIKSTINLEVDYVTKSEKTYESAFKKIYKHHTHKIHKCKKKEYPYS